MGFAIVICFYVYIWEPCSIRGIFCILVDTQFGKIKFSFEIFFIIDFNLKRGREGLIDYVHGFFFLTCILLIKKN